MASVILGDWSVDCGSMYAGLRTRGGRGVHSWVISVHAPFCHINLVNVRFTNVHIKLNFQNKSFLIKWGSTNCLRFVSLAQLMYHPDQKQGVGLVMLSKDKISSLFTLRCHYRFRKNVLRPKPDSEVGFMAHLHKRHRSITYQSLEFLPIRSISGDADERVSVTPKIFSSPEHNMAHISTMWKL